MVSGEVFWNEKEDPYLFGKPFESQINYDNSSILHVERKSKRKLFCVVIENDENQCNNSQQIDNFNKKSKIEEKISDNVLRFAAYPSSTNKMTNVLISPRKASGSTTGILQSPRKLNITPKKESDKRFSCINAKSTCFSSPTGNLPNIILDGRSPHEIISSAKCHGSGKKLTGRFNRKIDWLTEMSQQKKNAQPKKMLNKQQHATESQTLKDESLTFHIKS